MTTANAESPRVAAIRSTGLLFSAPEERFDRIARGAAAALGAPIAMIALAGQDHAWNKSCAGHPDHLLARDQLFAYGVVGADNVFSVADCAGDRRFQDHPWVKGRPGIRHYAGAPIRLEGAGPIGALAIMGLAPRVLTAAEDDILRDFAEMAGAEIAHGMLRERLLKMETRTAHSRDLPAKDALTRMWNRGAILDLLRADLARGMRGSPTTVAHIAVDGMEAINANQGRDAGDAVLVGVAECIRNCIRDFDAVGRDDGDSFLLVLSNCERKAATNVCERIRKFIAKQGFPTSYGPVKATASIGIATCGSGPLGREKVVAAAERAQLRAKLDGRNRTVADPANY